MENRTFNKNNSSLTKKKVKDIQEEEAKPNIFGIYESEVGILTPMIADALQEAENTYPAQWITDAIREAVKNNARNWKYIEAILKRWKAQGNQEGAKQKQNFIGKAIAKADEAVASVVDLATERLLSNGR